MTKAIFIDIYRYSLYLLRKCRLLHVSKCYRKEKYLKEIRYLNAECMINFLLQTKLNYLVFIEIAT